MIQFQCIPFHTLTLEQLYDLMALRQAVFVVEQDCPYLDADGKDQQGWHLLGYEDGQLVAYARLLPKGVSYTDYTSMGRIVTAEQGRGKGYGRQLMKEGIKQMEQLFGTAPIKISAQTYLIHFYQSFGFQPVGAEYLEDDIPHIAMIKK
jgi:ElaA protein